MRLEHAKYEGFQLSNQKLTLRFPSSALFTKKATFRPSGITTYAFDLDVLTSWFEVLSDY